jgi:WD40 repeat protein
VPAAAALAETVPAELARTTVRLAVLFARGPAKECSGSGAAVALARGGMHLMFWTRLKSLLAVLLVAAFVGAGTALLPLLRTAPAAAPPNAVAAAEKDLYGDPLPPQAIARLGTIRFRLPEQPFGTPFALCFSRDGKTLLSAGDRALRFWDASTGRPLGQVSIGKLRVRGAAISADGKWVAVGGFWWEKETDPGVGMIRILDATTGKEVRRFERGQERSDYNSLAFTPDGKILISFNGSGIVRLEEVATGTELLRHKFPGDVMADLTVSTDGKVLAVATGPNTRKVFVWEWQEGKEPREIKVPPRGAYKVAFSPDGKMLATGDDVENGIRLWDVASGQLLRRLGDRTDSDRSQVCFSPDGRYLAGTSSRQKALILWDPKTGKEVRRMAGLRVGASSPVFSADSKRLAAIGDGVVRVWDVATGKDLVPDETAHRHAPSFVTVLADGTAITGGDDGTVRLWDSATGKQRRKIEVAPEWVRAVAVSPDGRWLATSELGDKHAVRLWDLGTGREVYRLAGHGRLGGHRALAFTPDSKQLASWGDDMYLRLWDVQKGKAILEHEVRPDGGLMPHEREGGRHLRDFASEGVFSRDAGLLMLGGNPFFVFEVKSGKQLRKIPHEGGHTLGMRVSPDGKYLLVCSWGRGRQVKMQDGKTRITTDDPFVGLYDVSTGKEVRRVNLPGEFNLSVAFSADGKTFAIGTKTDIRLYTTATGAASGTLATPARVYSLAFAPDDKRIIAGLADTTAVIWNIHGR